MDIVNKTSDEMLARLNAIDNALSSEGLTDDAVEALRTCQSDLVGQFTVAAEYAQALADETGVEFPNPLASTELDNTTAEVVLTPEQQEFKESLMDGFELSYSTYTSLLDVMNSTKERKKDKLETATEAEAREVIEDLLTPGVIHEAMRNVEEFTNNPEKNSPEARARILLVVDQDLNASDETAVAKDLQTRFKEVWHGEDYVYEPLHNQDTAHKATSPDAKVRALVAFDHLTIRKGVVTEQRTQLKAHNNDTNNDTLYVTGDDIAAMTRITQLIGDGAIDAVTEGHVEDRFRTTYYKDVLAEPVGGRVSNVCVRVDGRVFRARSYVESGHPSRALMVPKV